jgi:ferric enterobactin receptor
MIDHIDVIRGPAAARYGNGAMGGVVNIVTKPVNNEWHGSWNTYMNAPQHRGGDEADKLQPQWSAVGQRQL